MIVCLIMVVNPSLNISTQARTIEASRKLLAGAGKFAPVACGNRWQSKPLENFACIHREFYLRNNLPAAIAGNFARASFKL